MALQARVGPTASTGLHRGRVTATQRWEAKIRFVLIGVATLPPPSHREALNLTMARVAVEEAIYARVRRRFLAQFSST